MIRKVLKPFIAGLIVIFVGAFVITYFNLYDIFPHLDKLFHVAGGFVVAWFLSNFWEDSFKGLNKFQRVIVFMALAGLVGFFWEVAEYSTSTSLFDGHQLIRHYVFGGSNTDTLGDIMADVFGGALFALFF